MIGFLFGIPYNKTDKGCPSLGEKVENEGYSKWKTVDRTEVRFPLNREPKIAENTLTSLQIKSMLTRANPTLTQ